jgi:GNAT superfamily N-acetyltransferase
VSSQYQIRFYTPVDRKALEDLYQAVYAEAWREKTRLEWYLDRPLDAAGAAVAVAGDVMAAAQPYCDFPLHTPWGAARATLFFDVVTHPAHRRRGLFRRVVAAARTAAFERGASIILTTPNRTAFQGFQAMPGWIRLCSLDCLFLPLRTNDRVIGGGLLSLGARIVFATAARFWKRPLTQADWSTHLPYDIKSSWTPGNEADALWACATAHMGIMVRRDRSFLQWRFGSHDQLFLACGPKGPVGYAAARIINRAGLRIGMLLDCVTIDDKTSALPLLGSVIAWLREQGASAAIGYFLRQSTPWHQACAAGFLPLPRLLMPRDYPVCASVWPENSHSADLLDPSCWYMSLADSDLA